MKKRCIMLLILALILAPLCSALAEDILGQPFPDFTATDTEGNTFTLSEALQDHEAVLVNLWASWCPPCEAEFPDLTEVYEAYKDRVAFIALSCEPDDTLDVIGEYRRSHGITFPMGRDEDQEIIMYTGTDGIPTTVIVDRFGNAAFFRIGMFESADMIKSVLDNFLGEAYTQTAVIHDR